MVAALLITGLVLALFFLYGWAAVNGLRKLFRLESAGTLRPVLYILAGMVVLIWIAQIISLVMPLAAPAFLIIFTGGIVAGWMFLRSPESRLIGLRPLPVVGYILFGLVSISVLENSTHLAANFDTGLYHAQAIRWIETYPTVPGLGNLHTRFAFNSSWLVLNALFSFSFLGMGSFHLVPAALTLAAVLDFASGAVAWWRGEGTSANILRAFFLPVTFYVLGSQISSPGTDLPVILTLWLLLTAWLDRLDPAENSLRDLVVFLGAVSLLTLKLSALPVLLLGIWIWLKRFHRPVDRLNLIVIGILLLLPWFARNVILSGYLIYPFPAVDWFNPDWKIPIEIAESEVRTIRAWGRDPGEAVDVILAEPFSSWFHLWFIEKTANQKIILLATGASIFVFLAGILNAHRIKDRADLDLPALAAGYGTAAAGALYWLLSSPDIRFGYGFLLALIGLSVTPWLALINGTDRRTGKILGMVITLLLIAYQLLFFLRSFETDSLGSRMVLPLAYPQLPSEPCAFGDGQVWCAGEEAWTQCWYEPFPCIPQPNEWAEQRGADWGDGFRPKQDWAG